MKVCGYCNNEYNDTEPKCPVCGSTLLKHNKHSDPAEAELKRIKDEIERKRKSRSLIIGIGAIVVILAIIIAIFSVVGYVTDPQRDIAKESKVLFAQAEQQVDNKDYGAAIDTLDRINPKWDDYADAQALRLEAVRGQLTTKVAEYQAAGNYQAIITFIKENVADLNADMEIKAVYDDAVQQYVTAVQVQADEYVAAADFNAARTVLNTAIALIGEDVNITAKLAEIENVEVLATIKGYEDNGDYLSLVSYLEGVAASNSNYYALLNQYTQILVDNTLASAQTYADNRQFEEAIQIITQTQQVYDCPELQEASVTYGSCLPIQLIDCYVVQDKLNWKTSGIDSLGNERTDSLVITGDGYYDESITYNLDGRFVCLSGEMVHVEGGFYDSSVQIKIFLDDKLLYTSDEISVTTQPIAFSVDVTGGELLRIEYDTVTYSLFGGGCIIDATLS